MARRGRRHPRACADGSTGTGSRDSRIAPYSHGNRANLETERPRKLLLHRNEIIRFLGQIEKKGSRALVPLKGYLKNGRFKILDHMSCRIFTVVALERGLRGRVEHASFYKDCCHSLAVASCNV